MSDIKDMAYDIINLMPIKEDSISDVINLENYDLAQKQYQEHSDIPLEDIEDYIFNSESDQFKLSPNELINFNCLFELGNNLKIIERINEVQSNLEQSHSEDSMPVCENSYGQPSYCLIN